MTTNDSDELKYRIAELMFLKLGIDMARTDTQYPLVPAKDRDQFLTGAMQLINQTCEQRVREAIESARSKDPLTCEFGHKIVSHNTADGWCCACDADIAFLEERVREAMQRHKENVRLGSKSWEWVANRLAQLTKREDRE